MSENRCVCCNAIIPEGRQVCKKCEAMAEHKTADEMFQELGYKKIIHPDADRFAYVKNHDGYFTERIDVNERCMISFVDDEVIGMNFEEILACAQLIREMGWVDA